MKRLYSIIFLIVVIILSVEPQQILASDIDIKDGPSITLDGMIGPYDPTSPDYEDDPFYDFIDPDNPNNSNDIEGTIPEKDQYYTIAVTVPTDMQFTIFKLNGQNSFYSPQYKISNNATRPIHVSVSSVGTNEFILTDEFTPIEGFYQLYLRKPNPFNRDAEIELYLSMLNKTSSVKRSVFISEDFDADNSNENHYLGVLGLKETGILQFESTNWDSPGKNAKTNFKLTLQFSLEEPIHS